MARVAKAAAYWAAVLAVMPAWHIVLAGFSYPLGVHVALMGLPLMAGLWGHFVLFPHALHSPRRAVAPEARLAPASLVIPPPPGASSVPGGAPLAAPPSGTATPVPPHAALRDLARNALAEASGTGGERHRQELAIRREFDAEFAAAAAGLSDEEAHALLACARNPLGREHLAACAELVRLLGRFGRDLPVGPELLRLRDVLADVAEPLAKEFLRIMAAAPDLDPRQVSRRLLERHAGAGSLGTVLIDERRIAETISAALGVKVTAQLDRGNEPGALLMPAPDSNARLPLPLLLQFSGLLAREERPAPRALLAAALQAGPSPALRAVLEAYVATVARPEDELLAALRGALQGIAAPLPRQPESRDAAPAAPWAGIPLLAQEAPTGMPRWRMMDGPWGAEMRAA